MSPRTINLTSITSFATMEHQRVLEIKSNDKYDGHFIFQSIQYNDPVLFPIAAGLREEVFVNEQGFAVEVEFDEQDATCQHWLLQYHPGKGDEPMAVAYARCIENHEGDEAIARIGRLVVKKAFRGIGVGSAIMLAIERDITRAIPTSRHLLIHSQADKCEFYGKLGYVLTKMDAFYEDGVLHKEMIKCINLES